MSVDTKHWELRNVCPEDSEHILAIANSPTVRALSFSATPISLEEHNAWFSRRLARVPLLFYVMIVAHREPLAGYVRFDMLNDSVDTARVSTALAERWRGMGMGRWLMEKGTKAAFRDFPMLCYITASIKTDNIASQKMCEAAKFIKYDNLNGMFEYRLNRQQYFNAPVEGKV